MRYEPECSCEILLLCDEILLQLLGHTIVVALTNKHTFTESRLKVDSCREQQAFTSDISSSRKSSDISVKVKSNDQLLA